MSAEVEKSPDLPLLLPEEAMWGSHLLFALFQVLKVMK